jgi:hypothetical protein
MRTKGYVAQYTATGRAAIFVAVQGELSFCFGSSRWVQPIVETCCWRSQQSRQTVLAEADTLRDYFSFSMTQQPLVGRGRGRGRGLLITQASRPRPIRHTKLRRNPLDGRSARQRSIPDNTQHSQKTDFRAGGIRHCNPIAREAAELRLRPRGEWDRHSGITLLLKHVEICTDCATRTHAHTHTHTLRRIECTKMKTFTLCQ